VDKHNEYRTLVAKGESKNKLCCYAPPAARMLKMSMSAWFSELEHKGVPKENRLTMEVFNHGVGHYSQVIWQWSNKVGCAVVWCKDMTLVG
ncbi:hypothetical protein V3C99_014338, partial [Haemonchus contortus]